MSDASSIRLASSLSSQSSPGAAFYKSALRFYNNQPYYNSGSQWVGIGNVVISVGIAATAGEVDQNIFIADRAYQVVSVSEAHAVAEATATTLTLAVKKAASGVALASGTNVLSSTFNMKSAANTPVTLGVSATAADSVLAAGDRLALDFSATAPTELAGGVVTVVLRPV
jgi:hypothetical protein